LGGIIPVFSSSGSKSLQSMPLFILLIIITVCGPATSRPSQSVKESHLLQHPLSPSMPPTSAPQRLLRQLSSNLRLPLIRKATLIPTFSEFHEHAVSNPSPLRRPITQPSPKQAQRQAQQRKTKIRKSSRKLQPWSMFRRAGTHTRRLRHQLSRRHSSEIWERRRRRWSGSALTVRDYRT
jgi:hypothetical protein